MIRVFVDASVFFSACYSETGASHAIFRLGLQGEVPVVAAARMANVDYLVSLDRRHLVGQREVATSSGLRIVLPGEVIGEIRRRAA